MQMNSSHSTVSYTYNLIKRLKTVAYFELEGDVKSKYLSKIIHLSDDTRFRVDSPYYNLRNKEGKLSNIVCSFYKTHNPNLYYGNLRCDERVCVFCFMYDQNITLVISEMSESDK